MNTPQLFPTLRLLAATLLAFVGASAFALTVPVSQDTSSNIHGQLTSAAGRASLLAVTPSQFALLDFDLSNTNVVPMAISPAQVKSALLVLYIVSTSTNADLSVHLVTSPWKETFKPAVEPLPNISPTPLTMIPASALPSNYKGFVSVDITQAVVAALNSGTDLSVAIETTVPHAVTLLGTKEGPASGYAAQIDIDANLTGSSAGQSPNQDTAIGLDALQMDTSGSNTAMGYHALSNNTTGTLNVAVGDSALLSITGGAANTAIGYSALSSNQSGYDNTGIGFLALSNNSGSNNVALGYEAGDNNVSGSDNIFLGNVDASGLATGNSSESNTIRIGAPDQQTATYVAGIYGQSSTDPTATLVYVDQTGRLVTSSTAPLNLPAGSVPASAVSGTIPATQAGTPPHGMVLIPAGSFTMGNVVGTGSDSDIIDAAPVTVTLSAYYMDANLVSLSEWNSVYYWAKNNGYSGLDAGAGDAAHNPVYNVNWYDCVKWCNARSEQAHLMPVYYTDSTMTTVYRTGNLYAAYMNMAAGGYRLPTEAEWENAARGGIAGQRFPWGNTIDETLANYYGSAGSPGYDNGPNGYNALDANGKSDGGTTPIGTFAANGYGIYDMAGNVFEWCWDLYGTPYPGGTNPTGPSTGSGRVLRGGFWSNFAGNVRCANRGVDTPDFADFTTGFRCVLSPSQP